MRRLTQLLVLLAAPMAAYAQPDVIMDTFPVPEPETLSLLAIGTVAIVLAARRRKK